MSWVFSVGKREASLANRPGNRLTVKIRCGDGAGGTGDRRYRVSAHTVFTESRMNASVAAQESQVPTVISFLTTMTPGAAQAVRCA